MTATAAGAGPFGIDAAGEGGEGAVLQLPVAGTGPGGVLADPRHNGRHVGNLCAAGGFGKIFAVGREAVRSVVAVVDGAAVAANAAKGGFVRGVGVWPLPAGRHGSSWCKCRLCCSRRYRQRRSSLFLAMQRPAVMIPVL